MKPRIFTVGRRGDFPTKDDNHQFAVNLFLDCMLPWIELKKEEGLFEYEKARINEIIQYFGALLNKITTFPTHTLNESVKIDTDVICTEMIERLVFLSPDKKEKGLQLIKKHLDPYFNA